MYKRKLTAVLLIATLLLACLPGCGSERGSGEIIPVENGTAYLVDTVYPTEDVVIADVIATDEEYGADPTAQTDSTMAIQKALRACARKGGGTVWLPAGRYQITGKLTIPAFVTLRGEWQDPDVDMNVMQSTVLMMNIPPEESDTGTITLSGSAGVMGLTVYYPHQTLEDVKPYPFTFYVNGLGEGYMLQSIVNCTLINAYKGIGACVAEGNPHEMMTVDTVKGTVLSVGAEVYNQADVGTWKNVTFSPKYWAQIRNLEYQPKYDAVAAYTREQAVGLRLGDLEWTEFANLNLSDFSIGIHIVSGKRIQFAGSLYDVQVTDCGTALQADNMDSRWGTLIAKGILSGDRSLVNNTGGTVRLTGVTLEGLSSGTIEITDAVTAEDLPEVPQRVPPKPAAKLTVVAADSSGKTDISGPLQQALTDAGTSGGGVVYLPAGVYRLDKPVTVPAGVELRGCSSVAQREQSGNSDGTLLLIYPATCWTMLDADRAEAMVTLDGDRAGVRGLRFLYPDNITALSQGKKSVPASGYTIRGNGAEVYAINVAITGGYNGIDFRGCDRHYIKKMVGCSIANAMAVGGTDGLVEGCLQNANALCRMGVKRALVTPVAETEVFSLVFDPVTRQQTELIRVENGATGQTVFNTFAYGVRSSMVSNGELTAFNIGADNIGSGSPLLDVRAGSTTVINMMRYNGSSYRCAEEARLRLYNRLTIANKSESPSASEG